MQHLEQLDSDETVSNEGVLARVLVVDDVPTNRTVLKSLLSKPNCEVFEAEDGERAIEAINSLTLDLVVLDIVMPGLNGIEVLQEIRKQYTTSQLPVLMLTVKDDIDDVVKALELGANDYVTRPIDYAVLVARINTLITYKRTQDSIQESQNYLESKIAERTSELVTANEALQVEVIERKQAETQAKISQEKYRLLYDDTPSMFFTLNSDGRIQSVNQYGADYLGFSMNSIVRKSMEELHEERDRDLVADQLRNCLAKPENIARWEACMLRQDGSKVWVRTSARVMSGDPLDVESILLVCEDITETYILSEQLSYQAQHDALTGLLNRYEFERRLQSLLEDARQNQANHALLYMDLDQFKVINDTCGHDAGDELLRQLGRLLKKYVSGKDTLARLGGDEFAALLVGCNLNHAGDVARTLYKAITDFRFVWRDASFNISVSIGAVAIEHTTENIASLLSAADTACYSAKEEGPNHVHVYQPDDEEVVRRHREMAWIAKINKALEEDRFELYYHPIVPMDSVNTGPIQNGRHYELLLRMRDENGKIVLPGAFLPAAERYKSAAQVDRWVVGHALSCLSQYPEHLKNLEFLSINLSGQSVGDKGFLNYLLDHLQSSCIAPAKICFELTETATIANLANATEFMEELRARGCRIALDDFGTGLSSFEYLKNLPIDFIKIDGQFISDVANDPINYAMVKAISDIAKVMSKKTIAEFVETDTTLKTLEDIGVDFAQGNVFSEPQPLSSLLEAM